MRAIIYLSAITLLLLTACNQQAKKSTDKEKLSITGKWHRFSMANGYTEFDIDAQNVVFYNQKVGRFKLPYKIKNDSIIYLTKPYAAKITARGDSILLEGNDSTTAVLHRFAKTNDSFTQIPEEKDTTAFASYVKGFDQRLIQAFRKAGIELNNNTMGGGEGEYQRLLGK
ncbi:hypothetical protein LT679_18030 [Mucilaginibacter roseus]|uniref:Lipocalin-like domain-containing protein n=1 Tax=Mucilaginibacter roseus TaxID=1528868 RepID=A0ABS8U908_9SPHI|nr:hypothetical protein [Mucilaginibacter roseus]MCD8742514.1 hypothetical protein [Mucilaginibacter roseus]